MSCPPSVGSTAAICNCFFHADALKMQIEIENLKDVLPAFGREHMCDFQYSFHADALGMQIELANLKDVFPAFGGEHLCDASC